MGLFQGKSASSKIRRADIANLHVGIVYVGANNPVDGEVESGDMTQAFAALRDDLRDCWGFDEQHLHYQILQPDGDTDFTPVHEFLKRKK